MKKKIILDCDPGHDDAVAIMLAIANDNIDVLGITCVAGNASLKNTKLNVLKICSIIDKSNISVYAGESKPLIEKLITAAHVHGKSGLDIEGSPIKIKKKYFIQDMHAVDFIIKTCHEQNNPIYLCPTGPLTNIAKALTKDPTIKKKYKTNSFYGGSRSLYRKYYTFCRI